MIVALFVNLYSSFAHFRPRKLDVDDQISVPERLALQFRVTTASSPSAIDALSSSSSRIISTSQSPFKRSARGRQSPADSLPANKATRRRTVEACQRQNRPQRKGLASERERKMTWNNGENGPAFEKWMGFEIRGII
jgi:hypothetical protein